MSFPSRPRDRYQRDPAFRQLVDILAASYAEAQFTGTELREAAILAAQIVEELRPTRIGRGDLGGDDRGIGGFGGRIIER